MIVAVVVTHDPPSGALERCLDSLVGEVDRVIVVDNGGQAAADGRAAVELIRTDNRGYGAAANVGFERALADGADVIVLLNDDAAGRPGWVSPLTEALAAADVGAAQPVLVVAGTEPPLVNSRGVQIGPDGAGTDVAAGEAYLAADADHGHPGHPVEPLELFTGGAVAFRADFVRATGGFEERWFLYYEDVDLARRGTALGFRYVLVGSSVVEHEGSVTTARMPDRTRFLQERNRLWCAFRWGDRAMMRRALWLSVRRLRHHPRRVHMRALLAGLRGAPSELRRR